MRSRVGVVLIVFASWCTSDCSEANKNRVLQWNDTFLEALRVSRFGPPMASRALAIFQTCIYDAWAAYDKGAIGTKFRGRLRQPASERTAKNKEVAISYAAYRAGIDLFPAAKEKIFDRFMLRLGFDPTDRLKNKISPVGIGNIACGAVLQAAHRDGSNQLGNMTSSGVPYADYTGYSSINPRTKLPLDFTSVKDPDRFQPLEYSDALFRTFFSMQFIGAHWFKVKPFAGSYDKELSHVYRVFPLARYGSYEFDRQVGELVDLSATLTDEQKMISEYWTDGPNSELPAGHWALLAQFVSLRDRHGLDEDVKMFFVLANAISDAGIAAWTAKRTFDSVRPITAIPLYLRGKKIRCWAGPGRGTEDMDGRQWIPYQPLFFPTPPFPEYPSGHSTFSSAAARILELWTGDTRFGASATIVAGSSKIEPGITPKTDITLAWPTLASAADQAGMSRRYGGLHFNSGDLAGRALGRLVADKVYRRSLKLFH